MGGCGAGHTEHSGITVGQIRDLIQKSSVGAVEREVLLLLIRVRKLEERVRLLEEVENIRGCFER